MLDYKHAILNIMSTANSADDRKDRYLRFGRLSRDKVNITIAEAVIGTYIANGGDIDDSAIDVVVAGRRYINGACDRNHLDAVCDVLYFHLYPDNHVRHSIFDDIMEAHDEKEICNFLVFYTTPSLPTQSNDLAINIRYDFITRLASALGLQTKIDSILDSDYRYHFL